MDEHFGALFSLLEDSNENARLLASEAICSYSPTIPFKEFISNNPKMILFLFQTMDNFDSLSNSNNPSIMPLNHNLWKALVNISNDPLLHSHFDIDRITRKIQGIDSTDSTISNLACMILSNVTMTVSISDCHLSNLFKILISRREDQDKNSKEIQIHSDYNCDLQFLSLIMANSSQYETGRKFLKDNLSILISTFPSISSILLLDSSRKYSNLIGKRGTYMTIKNCLLEESFQELFLRENTEIIKFLLDELVDLSRITFPIPTLNPLPSEQETNKEEKETNKEEKESNKEEKESNKEKEKEDSPSIQSSSLRGRNHDYHSITMTIEILLEIFLLLCTIQLGRDYLRNNLELVSQI